MVGRLFNRYTLAFGLIVLGLLLVFFFGRRAVRSYHEIRYVREQGLDRGTASVDAIQPWMPIRYVAVAYAVPEEYLFAELDIPYNRRNANDTLGRLNREYDFGPLSPDGRLIIVERVAAAIEDYRENPVATGLDDVRPWMTIRYIANSSGVPESYLLEALSIGAEQDQAVRPLDQLAKELHWRDGPRGLSDDIKQALRDYEGAQ